MNSWLLDIDGVITNLLNQRIEKKEILNILSSKLNKGETVGLISGRAFSWVHQNLVPLISAKSFDNLFIATEFASVITTFTDHREQKYIDPSNNIPEYIRNSALEISKEFDKFALHETKEVIISFRMNPSADFNKFKEIQKLFANKLRDLLNEHQLQNTYEVLTDALGINIRKIGNNKSLAVDKFIKWQSQKKIAAGKYYAFGDSDSDLEMGNELRKQKKTFEFIYVGETLSQRPDFPIIKTQKKNDEGTLEYFQSRE